MNNSRSTKTRPKSKAFHKHGKHGGMRGISAEVNRKMAKQGHRRQKLKQEMVDAQDLSKLFD